MLEEINAESVSWEFERVTKWSDVANGLTTRLALFLNTIQVLKKLSDDAAQAPFFFRMHARLRGKEFSLVPPGETKYLATEAGFFLPINSGGGYTPFIDFFDYLHKYKHLIKDHRIIIDAMNCVADSVLDVSMQSHDQQTWRHKSSELSAVFSDPEYVLRQQNDDSTAIADRFPFLHEYEDIRPKEPSGDGSTGEFIMTVMRDIASSLMYQREFDFPNGQSLAQKRQAHQEWVSGFDRSNISYSREGSFLSGKGYSSKRYNPQAAP